MQLASGRIPASPSSAQWGWARFQGTGKGQARWGIGPRMRNAEKPAGGGARGTDSGYQIIVSFPITGQSLYRDLRRMRGSTRTATRSAGRRAGHHISDRPLNRGEQFLDVGMDSRQQALKGTTVDSSPSPLMSLSVLIFSPWL